jgi:hypothetical protein
MADILATWPRQELLLLLNAAQLMLLTVVGWLISRRLARHIRFQQKLAQQQVDLTRAAATYRAHGEDPHTTVRRIATNATRRPIGELTPLRGGVAPTYLLFREDDTRRRLLLAAGGDLQAALRVEGVRRSPLPWRRPPVCTITPFTNGALALEEIADAWAALADRLGLLSVLPSVGRWELVELPPEELGS